VSAIAADGWTVDQMPDQSGRTIVVTGANSGLGFETARAFAHRGAHVVMGCRSIDRAKAAIDRIQATVPSAEIDFVPLDLGNLASIQGFAKECVARYARIHVLCNNAGVMAIPLRRTADGFEMQLGTNHLGHFALTGQLLPLILDSPGARIVTVSSNAHKLGRIRVRDLNWESGYSRWPAYGQSKLANLLFTYELQRRLSQIGAGVRALASHPGYADTDLQFVAPRMDSSSLSERVMVFGNRLFAQSAAMGALPSLYAATSEALEGGEYIGPSGFAQMTGSPKIVASSRRSRDAEMARYLWNRSEALTGVHFEELEGSD
jgi:NAD(P)-dependent dehydrogenase (short-subunit alcohol dehydrogenase family)